MAGGPVPEGTLESTIRGSDLIVAATVVEIKDAPGDPSLVSPDATPERDRLRIADAEVLRVLAGEAQVPSLEILFLEGRVPSRPWIGLWTDQPLLLFLRASARHLIVADATMSPIRTLARIPQPEMALTADHAVAHELEQIILRADTTREANILTEATAARLQLPLPLLIAEDAEAMGHEPLRRTAWAAVSLASQHLAELADVAALLSEASSPELEVVRRFVVGKIAEIRNPQARPELAALLSHPWTAVARSAARALRAFGDARAAPHLADALDHPDQEVRYHALMGLAELYPDAGPAPSWERFRAAESEYRNRWKDWWSQRGFSA